MVNSAYECCVAALTDPRNSATICALDASDHTTCVWAYEPGKGPEAQSEHPWQAQLSDTSLCILGDSGSGEFNSASTAFQAS